MVDLRRVDTDQSHPLYTPAGLHPDGYSYEDYYYRDRKDKTAELVVITHEANSSILDEALLSISRLEGVIKEPVCLSIYS